MYTITVEFKILDEKDSQAQQDAITNLFDTWKMNGQVLGDEHIYAQTVDAYKMFLLTAEKDSLHSKYNNKYTKLTIKQLKTIGLATPTFTILDKNPQEDDLCKCNVVTEYILYTTYICLSPPLHCKKCFGTIPLYKIPKLYDDSDYYPLITWKSDYQSCDALQMNCGVGERFALRQLSFIDSQLTKDGLDICKKIQEVTGKKTYYYLYKQKAKSKKHELLRKCPQCHADWLRSKPLHDKFDFECQKCGLLSNIAWDVR